MLIHQKLILGLIALFVNAVSAAFTKDGVYAQNITLDGSLGPTTTLNGPNYMVPQNLGQTTGTNLFHSFDKFNLNRGESVGFESAASIRNIFSRVTGGNKSMINGRIYTTSPNVNFYFLNPAGIVFGSNAQIDIGSANRGAFIATTAHGIGFGSSGTFVVSAAQTETSLLKVDPSALLFNQIANASITNQGSLRVNQGQSLLLVGGEVNLNSGQLLAPGGRVELMGVQSSANINLSGNGNELQLNVPEGVTRANVSLSNSSEINVRSGGSITITADNFRIADESLLRGGTDSRLGSINLKAGDVEIDATGEVKFSHGSTIFNTAAIENIDNTVRGNTGDVNIRARDAVSLDGSRSNGSPGGIYTSINTTGSSGNINITADSLFVTGGAIITTSFFGQGDGGDVNISTRDQVYINGGNAFFAGGVYSSAQPGARGQSGNINMTTGSLFLVNNGTVSSGSFGEAGGGSIKIVARDTVFIDGIGGDRLPSGVFDSGGVFSNVETGATGSGGSISITTGLLSVTNGGVVSGSTKGLGIGGSVDIFARDRVFISGLGNNSYSNSGIYSAVLSGARGDSSDITITTPTLSLTNGALVSANTSGEGNGGNIIINAETLEALDGGQVLTNSVRTGKSGNITLNVSDSITLSGKNPNYFPRLTQFGTDLLVGQNSVSGLFANVSETGTGRGGELEINTAKLVVRDGAQITVSNFGSGDAGSLKIYADSISLSNLGKITGETASGEGGNLMLRARNSLLLRHGSAIATTARNNGNGGNITIDALFAIAHPIENSDIIANAERGFGGRIDIKVTDIYGLEFRGRLTTLSDINASSSIVGQDGTVKLNNLEEKSNREVTKFPSTLVDVSPMIAHNCLARNTSQASSFTITGTSGLPTRPQDMVIAPYPTSQVHSLFGHTPTETSPTKTVNSSLLESANTSKEIAVSEPIVEANSWMRDRNGDVILTAYALATVPELISQTCPG